MNEEEVVGERSRKGGRKDEEREGVSEGSEGHT
jgi:hypothetical protein